MEYCKARDFCYTSAGVRLLTTPAGLAAVELTSLLIKMYVYLCVAILCLAFRSEDSLSCLILEMRLEFGLGWAAALAFSLADS